MWTSSSWTLLLHCFLGGCLPASYIHRCLFSKGSSKPSSVSEAIRAVSLRMPAGPHRPPWPPITAHNTGWWVHHCTGHVCAYGWRGRLKTTWCASDTVIPQWRGRWCVQVRGEIKTSQSLSSPVSRSVCRGLIAFSFLPDTVIHLVIMLSRGARILIAERLSPFILLLIEIKENWQQLQDSRRQVYEWHLPPFNQENGGWIRSIAGAWRKAAYLFRCLLGCLSWDTENKPTHRYTVYTLLYLFKSRMRIKTLCSSGKQVILINWPGYGLLYIAHLSYVEAGRNPS